MKKKTIKRADYALGLLKKISLKFPNLGIAEISKKVGVHFSQFYRWEQGKEPSLESIQNIESAARKAGVLK